MDKGWGQGWSQDGWIRGVVQSENVSDCGSGWFAY